MLWFIIHGFQIDQTLLQINVFKVFQINKNEKQKKGKNVFNLVRVKFEKKFLVCLNNT